MGLHYCPPQFEVGIPDLLLDDYKEEKDPHTLEGHHDGENVGQREQFIYNDYQHSGYPR